MVRHILGVLTLTFVSDLRQKNKYVMCMVWPFLYKTLTQGNVFTKLLNNSWRWYYGITNCYQLQLIAPGTWRAGWPVLLQDSNMILILVFFVCGVLHINSIWSNSTWCQDYCKKNFDLHSMPWYHIFTDSTPIVKICGLFAQPLQQHTGCLRRQRPIEFLDREAGYVTTWRSKMKI